MKTELIKTILSSIHLWKQKVLIQKQNLNVKNHVWKKLLRSLHRDSKLWRKILQVYNIKIAFIKKVLFCFLLCTSSNLYAQSMQMPQMPAMPKMPTISSPTVNGRFYTPQPPKTQKQNSNSKTTTTTTTAPTETDKKGPEGFGGGVYPGNNSSVQMQQNQNSQNQNAQNQNVQNIANQKKINPSTGLISAQDVSMLYEAGLFGNYSSLLGAQSADSTTNIYLQQILASLQELKDNTKSLGYAEKENMENQQKDSKVFSKRAPSVVRFNINGYNIADSLVTVFISESENDGSFLFTADRVYYVDFQPRTECLSAQHQVGFKCCSFL